ncbi:MAG: hypothetical protein RMJ59_02180 [Candidatus Nitrosocaldus sp.]|nr:hypothetical protein [Candidatus Nitrosocaldus sp.]MDW8001011.1 hypothetical protein [Candidatus Nitrosocaldus sp.]MDW8275175.1 hypothetical protein [Candidatus Nitrosocaldus sp.]
MGRYANYIALRDLLKNVAVSRGYRFVEALENAPITDNMVILSLVDEAEHRSAVDSTNYRLKFWIDVLKFTYSSTDLESILNLVDAIIDQLDATGTYKTYGIQYKYTSYQAEGNVEDNRVITHARIVIESQHTG